MKKIILFFLSLSFLGLSGCLEKESVALLVARDMCSCRYVVEQTEANCRAGIRVTLLFADVSTNDALKEATASSEDGSQTATFRFVSPRFGCELKD